MYNLKGYIPQQTQASNNPNCATTKQCEIMLKEVRKTIFISIAKTKKFGGKVAKT